MPDVPIYWTKWISVTEVKISLLKKCHFSMLKYKESTSKPFVG